jgi:hypothetical protein
MKSSAEELNSHIQAWAKLYGRELNEQAVAVWHKIFARTERSILLEALEKVTAECERMPTPGHLTKAIAQVKENRGTAAQQGTRSCSCELCGGTGYKIVAKPEASDAQYKHYNHAEICGCHPSHATGHSLGPPAFDRNGVPCRIDPSGGDFLYRAVDCAEGREFLVQLAKVAGKSVDDCAEHLQRWTEGA